VSPKRVVFCAPNAQGNIHQAGAVFGSRADFGGLYDAYVGVTLHTYDPWVFCGESGHNNHWSTGAMTRYYDTMLQRVQQYRRSNGIPVHIGEFGVGRKYGGERDADIVREYYHHLTQAIASRSWPPALWDDGGWFAIVENFNWVYGLADAALNQGGPAPGPAPAPSPMRRICCWGGCSRCPHDSWCDASESNCRRCGHGSQWCSVPAQPPSTSDGSVAKLHVQVGADAAKSRPLRSLRAHGEAEDSAMLQGFTESRKLAAESYGEDEL